MQGSILQNRCSVQVLCIVSIQLAASTIINIKSSSGSNFNETHSNVHQSNSAVAKSDPSPLKNYPNHRMDEEDTTSVSNIKSVIPSNKNSSFSHADREAASSILRPQLALQIYTNPQPQDSLVKSTSVFPRSFGPTMLIVPVQHKMTSDDFHLTSSTNQVRHPHHQQSSKSNQGKINQWRYLTYQGNNLLDGSPANGLSEYHPGTGGGPLINTIITVPASGEQQTSNHRNQQAHSQVASSHGSLQEDESKTSVDEQSIAKLLESQLAGNLEFTMTLNGEEITFNPATNKARITRIKSKGDSGAIESNEDEALPSIKRSSGRSSRDNIRIVSRALKTHMEPELVGDQQSASDIDISDSVNEEDDSDVEYDRFPPNTARQEEKIIKPRTSDDNEPSERDEKPTGSAQNRHWPMDMGDDADEQDSRYVDDQGINESSSENQLTKAKKNKDSSQLDSSGASSKKGNSKVTKTSGRKSSSSYQSGRKAQAGSRKRVIHKNIDQNNEDKSDEKDDVPSVIIKSDDVRRFEQLLENLRSISMNTQAAKNRRSGEKSSVKQKQAPVPDAEDDGKDDDVETSVDMKSESRQGSKASDNLDTTDCDRKRQQQLQKAASDDDSNSSYDLDSSPNTTDQEPSSESDSEKDNQDTDSQNGEQEEQTRHHPQKVAAPQMSSLGSNGDKQQQNHDQRSASTGRDKPKSVVLRKTVVQNYYNNDGDQMASQRDNIRSPYNAYDSTHEKSMSKLGVQLIPIHRASQHQELSSVVRRPASSESHHQNHEDHYSDMRPNSYQDAYNHQPADRDTVRASESQRVKTVILPKMLTMRKIKPLQEMIGKSLMKPTSTARVN